jgi:hypothetical protein
VNSSRNSFYNSVQKHCLQILLAKNLKIKIYKTVILLVLCGCETWFLTIREERRLKELEGRVLRRIFRPRRGSGRRLYKTA